MFCLYLKIEPKKSPSATTTSSTFPIISKIYPEGSGLLEEHPVKTLRNTIKINIILRLLFLVSFMLNTKVIVCWSLLHLSRVNQYMLLRRRHLTPA